MTELLESGVGVCLRNPFLCITIGLGMASGQARRERDE